MNFKELLNSKTPPKKDDLTDDDLARLFIKYKGLLKKLERDEAFWLATNENIKKAYLKLDELVEERTIELKIVNDQLQRELIERKKAETDLRKIAHQWQTTFDAMSESVFLLDIEKKFLQCNKATLDVLGKEKYDEIIGYSCYEIIHGINEPVEWCPMVRMIESGHKESSIAQIGDRWCDISVDPVINDEGTIIGAVHIITDITERKKSEQKLKESEEKYRYLIENSLEGVWVIDSNANAILINPSMAKMLGYTIEEMVGKSLFLFMNEKEIENTKINLERRKKGISEERDLEMIHKNGKKVYLRIRASPIFDIEGNYKGTFAFLSNITQRKLTEQNLKESEEKYRYLFDNAQVSLYWSRISDGKILECNDTFAKLFGYDTREDCLANYNAIEHYIEPNARSEILEELRDNKEVKNYEIYVTKRDGTPIWMSISARVFEKENRIEGAAIDITERKIAEEKLQLERDNFLNILNSMEDGIYIVDKNYDIEYINPSLIKEFGQFEGMKCFKYLHDLNDICPWCKNQEVFEGKTVRWEWYSPKNQKTYDLIDTPLRNPDGSLSKLEIFRDISESKKVEQVLKESEEKYREAYNRAEFYKDIFAHDINNILQSILSGTQISQLILDNPKKIDELKLNAEIIKEQVIRGAKLVSNVRKLSKLEEAGRSLENIEILKVLKNTVSFVKKSYKDKNLAIRVDSIGEKLFIKANIFLEDVFENLFINAIRHNRNLIIEITVRILRERRVGINYLKIEFLDNGFGVADSMKEKIFQRGYSKEKGVYGMGLGLSLVRGIIETYNGKIWVEDRVKGDRSKGSNFVLLIPEVD